MGIRSIFLRLMPCSLRGSTPWMGQRGWEDAAQPRAAARSRPCAPSDRGSRERDSSRRSGVLLSSGLLAETTSSARLETRTKESNVRASERVSNPSQAQGNRTRANPRVQHRSLALASASRQGTSACTLGPERW
jgi:hypothetical protein